MSIREQELHKQLQTWGYFRQAIKLYNPLLGKLDADLDCILLQGLGRSNCFQWQLQRAIEYHQQQLNLAREISNRQLEAQALAGLNLAYLRQGQHQTAIDYSRKSLAIAREIGDREDEALALNWLGQTYGILGEVQKAMKYHLQALAISREIGNQELEERCLDEVSTTYGDMGQPRRGIDYVKQQLQISKQTGDRYQICNSLSSLGRLYLVSGDYQESLEYFSQALTSIRENGDSQDIINQEERKILGSISSQFGGILPALAGDTSGNFSLPWKPGTSWNLNSGPHGQKAGTTPWNSLDLAGGDQKVLAATGGLFYKACSGAQVQIRQPNGWTTTYFHLTNTAQIKDGTSIQRGTYLGDTSKTAGSCDGYATGRHVHFSISLNGVKQSWNKREISGWTIYDGSREYQGRAEKDGKVVDANEVSGKALLYNPKYAIVSNVSNRCLDAFGAKVTSDGTPINIWDCHHGVAQQWKFVNNQIRNIEGKCLDVVNDGKKYENGSKIVLWNCHQGDNQKWSLNSDGTIRGIGGKCLDVVNDEKKYGNGTQVVLWQCHGGVNQKWRKVD